jgi:predicted Zn-dependent protease
MSTDEEVSLGKKAYPQILQKMGGTYPDDELQVYVQAVGDRLQKSSYRKDISYTFKVVNDSTPNAFALPGGYIAITRGLLVHLNSEEQLAAVLGHEIGHVDAKHAVQGMQRSSLLGLGLAVLSGASTGSEYGALIRSSGEVAATLLDRSYSRGQEEESDHLGIDYMVMSGYDPQGAVELQQIFYQKIDKGENPQWLGGLFRTHPFSKKRLDKNRAYIGTKYAQYQPKQIHRKESFNSATAVLQQVKPAYDLYDRAKATEKKGEAGEAIALYLQASVKAPDESLILTGLGMAYLRQEDLVSAKRHLQRAVRLDDNYFYSRLGLGYVYLEQKNFKSATKHLEKSMQLLPTLQGGYFLARAFDGVGKTDEALDLYRAVSESDPKGKLGRLAGERIRELERQ